MHVERTCLFAVSVLTLEFVAATVTVDADEALVHAQSTEALNGKIGDTASPSRDDEAPADNMAALRRSIDVWKARHI